MGKNKTSKSKKAVQELEVVSEDEHVVDQSTESTPQDDSVVNETEAQSQEEEESYETVATRISERESEIVKMQKANVRDHKLLARLHNKAVRDARKNRRNKNSQNRKLVKSGFNKPTPVPEAISKLFDIEPGTLLARTVVTKMIYQYIKDNSLQNPENKREINPDKKIRNLFSLSKSDTLSFENFQTHMKKLYPPSKKDQAQAQAQQESQSSA